MESNSLWIRCKGVFWIHNIFLSAEFICLNMINGWITFSETGLFSWLVFIQNLFRSFLLFCWQYKWFSVGLTNWFICVFFHNFTEISGCHLLKFFKSVFFLGEFQIFFSCLWVFALILKVFLLLFFVLLFLWILAWLTFCLSWMLSLLICDHFLLRPLWSIRSLSLFLFGYSM